MFSSSFLAHKKPGLWVSSQTLSVLGASLSLRFWIMGIYQACKM